MAQMSLKYFSPDMLIEVSRDSCGTFDFFKAREMIEMGREAAVLALDKLET
jgi:NTE family protein